MKLVELIHRTARRARTGDFTKLDAAEFGDVMQAVNTALQKTYNYLPIYFKQMTVGFKLPAPVSVSCQVTNDSVTLGNSPFTAAQLGCTVILDGDSAWNQVAGLNSLLNPYNGTTGTVTGTLYGDVFSSSRYPLDRIVGNPRFSDQSQLPIMRREVWNITAPYYSQTPSTGLPRNWWPDPFGNSQGRAPTVFLRFFPLPDQAYIMDVSLAYWPMRLTLDDYQANADIPVPEQFLETALLPLAIRALMSTPAYEKKGDEDDLRQQAVEAEIFLRQQPGQIGAPSNQVLTPIGF